MSCSKGFVGTTTEMKCVDGSVPQHPVWKGEFPRCEAAGPTCSGEFCEKQELKEGDCCSTDKDCLEGLTCHLGPSSPKAASWCARRALLTPQHHPGSCYPRGKCT